MEAFRKTHESHNHEKRTAIDALSMTVLVSGDRLITLNEEVVPALKRGEWVLCNRYTYTGNICCSDPIIQSISERFFQSDLAILAAADLMTVKNRVLSRPTEKHLFFDDHEVQPFVIIDTTQEQAVIDALLFAELSKFAERVH